MKRQWTFKSSKPLGLVSVHLALEPKMIQVLRRLQWMLSAIIVIAWGLSAWWWWMGQALDAEAARYAEAAGRTQELNRRFTVQMQRDELTLSPQQMAAIKQEVLAINQLADKRAFSWTQLLSDLEQALPVGTSIVKIQVDLRETSVSFDGLAARMQDLNALMARLQTGPAFSRPILHHHKNIDAEKSQSRDDDAQASEPAPAGVEFSLTVMYRRAA